MLVFGVGIEPPKHIETHGASQQCGASFNLRPLRCIGLLYGPAQQLEVHGPSAKTLIFPLDPTLMSSMYTALGQYIL